jgi:O-antigen ligase
MNYDRLIGKNFTDEQIIMELNKEDAGSMYLRLISEFGIPGLLLLIVFLVKYKVKIGVQVTSYAAHLNNLSLIMIITYCFRQGSYLSVYFLLFLGAYYYTYMVHRDSQLQKFAK